MGQLGQQGVTFDLQPGEWIAAATHALSAPAEVSPPSAECRDVLSLSQIRSGVQGEKSEVPVSLEGIQESFLSCPSALG